MSEFDPSAQNPEEQALRFGYNNDFISLLEIEDKTLLITNHESTVAGMMFSGEENYVSEREEHFRIEQLAHGLSIVEIRKNDGRWEVVLDSSYNRRITTDTQMKLTGPCAGNERLKTELDPTGTQVFGTLHNCSGGKTPWGTVLTCEENILYYFKGDPPDDGQQSSRDAYYIGYSKAYNWYKIDPRFDLSQTPNEPNRFGWVVEIDPADPLSIPKKRTALGRLFHESANPILSHDNRLVIYMGDDGAFEFLYRFVSSQPYVPQQSNPDLLDEGTLSVARFSDDGFLTWIPLIFGENGLDESNGFTNQADVLIDARRAGRVLKATPMDRTEDVEPNAHTGRVYVNCTNNARRGKQGYDGANVANPREPNFFGHIIELIPTKEETGWNHTTERMRWEIFILAGDPTDTEGGAKFSSYMTEPSYFGCPDNAAIDSLGRLWVTTDGSEKRLGFTDGMYALQTHGDMRGLSKRFFAAPVGAEITGPCFDATSEHLFLSVQHPSAKGWPYKKPGETVPLPSIVVIQHNQGKVIGT